MAGLARERLVLVKATSTGAQGAAYSIGTGFLLTASLVLTASHVVPEAELTGLEVRTDDPAQWLAVQLQPVWRDAALDAVLLRLAAPLAELPEVSWAEGTFDDDAVWHSSAYPKAGSVDQAGKIVWKTVGLGGKLQALGGGGQGARELELTVEAPPPAQEWAGISGAPVFVGDRLAGLVKEVPKSFQGGRLAAVPASLLLLNHGFRLALSKPWLDPLPAGAWVLVVEAERKKSKTGLADWVDGALTKDAKALEAATGTPFEAAAVRVRITDALESPGRWLRFVRALCLAPVAIFDATGFEPAVMLALGVRAVVHRGITLTSVADVLTHDQLSRLPFNIQETRLIHHGSGYAPKDVRHPLVAIPAAIKRGWQELTAQPAYLDLPAYDAVRCPFPSTDAEGRSALDRVLMLCSFGKEHEDNWLRLSNAVLAHYPDGEVARMLDMASPRLVGQALYEGIRWARTCVVDWTGWRANVFFEFGVRLACSDMDSVVLIEQSAHEAAAAPGALVQLQRMAALWSPTRYQAVPDDPVADDEAIAAALGVHDAIVRQQPAPVAATALPHDATFRTCRDHFDWKQEHITIAPHELLRFTIESPFGKDPQAGGRSPLLYSANAGYGRDLDHSVKERWIAAWCYLSQRHPKERWASDPALRAALRKLGNDVLQFGLPAPAGAHLQAMRDRIFDVLDELDDLDGAAP